MLTAIVFAQMISTVTPQLPARVYNDVERPPHNTQHDCPSGPETYGWCRLPPGLSVEDVQAKLGDKDTAWWRDGDQFIVVAKRNTDQAYVCCSIRGHMDHIGGLYWALRSRVVDLDSATIDVFVEPLGQTVGAYRGPNAPLKPDYPDAIDGQILKATFKSKFLDDPRALFVYLPSGFDASKTYPVVYMADGDGRDAEMRAVDGLIAKGELPPMVMIGISSGDSAGDPHLRNEEYLLGWPNGTGNFLKHESFLLKEVMPYAEKHFGASSDPKQRVLTGFSSGAAWVTSMGIRHPDVFPTIVAQSMVWKGAETGVSDGKLPRFYLSAGSLEPHFYTETLNFADMARVAGHEVVLEKTVSGHTGSAWVPLLMRALKWAYPK